MTSSCYCSPWPTQLGVRCGLPVSRNLSATQHQSRAGQRGGRGKEEGRQSGAKMEWQILEKKRNTIEHKLARKRNGAKEERIKCTELAKTWKVWRRYPVLTQKKSATCGSGQLIWMHRLSSALISACVEKAKCLYYFISQLAARRLLSLCAYWPAVCGYSFIVGGRSIKDR